MEIGFLQETYWFYSADNLFNMKLFEGTQGSSLASHLPFPTLGPQMTWLSLSFTDKLAELRKERTGQQSLSASPG